MKCNHDCSRTADRRKSDTSRRVRYWVRSSRHRRFAGSQRHVSGRSESMPGSVSRPLTGGGNMTAIIDVYVVITGVWVTAMCKISSRPIPRGKTLKKLSPHQPISAYADLPFTPTQVEPFGRWRLVSRCRSVYENFRKPVIGSSKWPAIGSTEWW